MMKYEIMDNNVIKVIGCNAKKETMEITLSSTVTDNPKDKKDMHYLWYKHGFTDRIMKSHINCHTYVRDSEGVCFGIYNPQSKPSDDKKRSVTNFDWILEDTEENRKKIIEECIRLFETATGRSATEEKIEHIKEVAKEMGIEVVSELPEGWIEKNYHADPSGAVTIEKGEKHFININGKHRKNPKFKKMLLIK